MMQLEKEIRLSLQVIPDGDEGSTGSSCDKKPAALPDEKVKARAPTPVMANGINSLKVGVDQLVIDASLRKYAKNKGHRYATATKHTPRHDQKCKKFELGLINSILVNQRELLDPAFLEMVDSLTPGLCVPRYWFYWVVPISRGPQAAQSSTLLLHMQDLSICIEYIHRGTPTYNI